MDPSYLAERVKFWFSPEERTDLYIREEFEKDLLVSLNGEFDSWKESPGGCRALILLWDQFPRNMYRDTPRSFAYDMLAQNLCLKGIATKLDRKLDLIERVFFYLPLEHAEDLEIQKKSVLYFTELVKEAPPELKKDAVGFCDYAVRHFKIVQQFRRFPHRNAILHRPSTPSELEFFKQPGSSF